MPQLLNFRRRPLRAKAIQLYGTAVAQARSSAFYRDLGVPDTPDGRLAMIALHVVILLERFSPGGDHDISSSNFAPANELQSVRARKPVADNDQELGRALMEAFVDDLDQAMREIGIGDMGVPKRVKKIMAWFYQLTRDYRAAIADGLGPRELGVVLSQLLPQVEMREEASRALQTYIRSLHFHVAEMALADLVEGRMSYPCIVEDHESTTVAPE